MKQLILVILLSWSSYQIEAQCSLLTLTQIKQIYNSQEKEDLLLELGFDIVSKRSNVIGYGKCRTVISRKGLTECTNNNESVTVFNEEKVIIYSTYNKTHYLKLKKIARTSMKYLGNNGEYDKYLEGNKVYGFSIELTETDCATVNRYTIMMSIN